MTIRLSDNPAATPSVINFLVTMTYTKSKTFKTEAAAHRWLARNAN
ncbi:DUF1391 family protein [Escherichia coli]